MRDTDHPAPAVVETDEATAVREAVLDYFEGWFAGDAARMERALHPELAKRSLGGAELDRLESTTAPEMIEATARGVGKTRLREGQDARIEVEIEEIYDTIANVTVRSVIYREYVHLIRTGSGWKIVNTVWQRTAGGGDAAE
jgi:Putative lumazine-binding